jgi:DNA-binding transcriptional regulator YhcF (GntR family)
LTPGQESASISRGSSYPGLRHRARRPGELILYLFWRLASQFGVARNTAVRALHLLRDEGLIVTQRGWGSFVAGDPGR